MGRPVWASSGMMAAVAVVDFEVAGPSLTQTDPTEAPPPAQEVEQQQRRLWTLCCWFVGGVERGNCHSIGLREWQAKARQGSAGNICRASGRGRSCIVGHTDDFSATTAISSLRSTAIWVAKTGGCVFGISKGQLEAAKPTSLSSSCPKRLSRPPLRFMWFRPAPRFGIPPHVPLGGCAGLIRAG